MEKTDESCEVRLSPVLAGLHFTFPYKDWRFPAFVTAEYLVERYGAVDDLKGWQACFERHAEDLRTIAAFKYASAKPALVILNVPILRD